MNASRYTVQFVGGPSDGLVLSDPYFDARDKLQTQVNPAVATSARTRCDLFAENWSPAYRLTSSRHIMEDGRPTTCLRYDFLGYEPSRAEVEGEAPRRRAPGWMIGLGRWFSRISRAFSKWMWEPIDYPLKVYTEEVTFSQRDAMLSTSATPPRAPS